MTGIERFRILSGYSGSSGPQGRSPRGNVLLARCKAAAAILALAVLGGCRGTSPFTSVSSLDFGLMDEQSEWFADNELVLPGSRLKLEATATGVTKKGDQVQRAIVRWEDYIVEVRGGGYDVATRNVWLSADENEIPEQGYEVSIVHEATGFRSTKRFRPDFARLNGPEPGDLTSFDVFLTQGEYRVPVGTTLIPGETYGLLFVAVDRLGRTFSSADPGYPIPAQRVNATFTNFRQPEGSPFTLVAAESAISAPDSYRIEAAYRESGFSEELNYRFDPVILQGPHPKSVVRVEIAGPLGDANLIPPGALVELEVRVIDNTERSWRLGMLGKGSHRANEYPLPPEQIDVMVAHGTFDRNTREVYFDREAKAMVGKSYAVSVMYRRDSSLYARRFYLPDFLSIVPLMEEDTLTYQAPNPDGRHGESGQSGENGRNGMDARDPDPDRNMDARSPTNGENGIQGQRGDNGGNGLPGPDIRVVAQEVSTVDGSVSLILLEVSASGETRYHVRRLDNKPQTIVSRGGAGGNGGDGGKGGNGGKGGAGVDGSAGGDGGAGGNGGDGGNGGNGGDLTLILNDGGLRGAFILQSLGGQAGSGGRQGQGGAGGTGGDRGEGSYGQAGRRGLDGQEGRRGSSGTRGRTYIDVQPGSANVAPRVPQSLRSVIKYD